MCLHEVTTTRVVVVTGEEDATSVQPGGGLGPVDSRSVRTRRCRTMTDGDTRWASRRRCTS